MVGKRPPTFQRLPKSHAKRLKKSWVEDHKIRSKWKAQKKREGLINQTRVEDVHDETNADPESDTAPNRPDKPPIPTPSHDKQSLRDLRKLAYASQPLPTQMASASRPKRVHGHSPAGRGTSQPNMKLRMNVLLEKIKRDLS